MSFITSGKTTNNKFCLRLLTSCFITSIYTNLTKELQIQLTNDFNYFIDVETARDLIKNESIRRNSLRETGRNSSQVHTVSKRMDSYKLFNEMTSEELDNAQRELNVYTYSVNIGDKAESDFSITNDMKWLLEVLNPITSTQEEIKMPTEPIKKYANKPHLNRSKIEENQIDDQKLRDCIHKICLIKYIAERMHRYIKQVVPQKPYYNRLDGPILQTNLSFFVQTLMVNALYKQILEKYDVVMNVMEILISNNDAEYVERCKYIDESNSYLQSELELLPSLLESLNKEAANVCKNEKARIAKIQQEFEMINIKSEKDMLHQKQVDQRIYELKKQHERQLEILKEEYEVKLRETNN